jgi:hypothetical protein
VTIKNERRRPSLREALEAAQNAAAPSPPTFADDPRLAELLALLHLGRLTPRVGARVAEVVRENPPDALERAAVHLRLTGANADHLLALAVAHGPTPAVDYTAEQETAA